MPHFLLQLKDTIRLLARDTSWDQRIEDLPEHQRLGGRRATRHIDIHGNNPIAPSRYAVAVVVVAATVRARAHGDDPARVGHLVVDLAKRGRHLVRERARNDHNVGLTRRGTEDDSHAVLVVTRRGQVHHLDGAAGEAESHGPEGALARPVGDLVEGCAGAVHQCSARICLHIFLTYSAYCMAPCFPSWLGNGTSWCGFPVIDFIEGGVPDWPATRPGFCVAGSAPLEEEEEMKAALAARKGWRAAVGLAVVIVQYAHSLIMVATLGVPRSAIVVACLVEANMVACVWW